MVNINLATEKINVQRPSLLKKEMIFLVILLVLLIAVYGGLLVYEKNLNKKIKDIDSQYAVNYQELTGGNTKNVFDFQNRLTSANKLFPSGGAAFENLKKMEAVIIPGAYISSFSYNPSSNEITLDIVASSFNLLAKQVLNFKKSGYFSNISVGASQIEKTDITLAVILTAK